MPIIVQQQIQVQRPASPADISGAKFAKLYINWRNLRAKNLIQQQTLEEIQGFWIKNTVSPVLNVDTNDEDWLLQESVSAIHAMNSASALDV